MQVPATADSVQIARLRIPAAGAVERVQRRTQTGEIGDREAVGAGNLLRHVVHASGARAAARRRRARRPARMCASKLPQPLRSDQAGRSAVEAFWRDRKQRSAVRQHAGDAVERQAGIRHVGFPEMPGTALAREGRVWPSRGRRHHWRIGRMPRVESGRALSLGQRPRPRRPSAAWHGDRASASCARAVTSAYGKI